MNKNSFFALNNLTVSVDEKIVVRNVNLLVHSGSVHALMGPNGSGKSSLAYALAGHPYYRIVNGSVLLNEENILALPAHERAQQGVFLSFQSPCEIPGVSVSAFLREAYTAVTKKTISVLDFAHLLNERCNQLGIDPSFCERGLNDGFSGGEKKKLEILQLLMLQPKLAILDEIDSGLDVDALKVVAQGINRACAENPDLALIIITHYQRILDYITPDYVHVMYQGALVASGNASLAHRVEAEGYEVFGQ
jgi:Fe-S cluster assembly ATP-binding protein